MLADFRADNPRSTIPGDLLNRSTCYFIENSKDNLGFISGRLPSLTLWVFQGSQPQRGQLWVVCRPARGCGMRGTPPRGAGREESAGGQRGPAEHQPLHSVSRSRVTGLPGTHAGTVWVLPRCASESPGTGSRGIDPPEADKRASSMQSQRA